MFAVVAEPTSVDLHVDGVSDICTKEEDINFVFTGFSVFGTVRKDLDTLFAPFCPVLDVFSLLLYFLSGSE